MIKERFLSVNKYSRPNVRMGRVKGIVLHYVGVNFQKAETVVRYFEGLKNGVNNIYASAHYVIDMDGSGFICIPENEVAYHCGAKTYKAGIQDKLGYNPNYSTIGIEMCHTNEGFTEETIKTVSNLVCMLLHTYGLSVRDVYRHYDITGKLCPKFWVEDEKKWVKFKEQLEKLYFEGNL